MDYKMWTSRGILNGSVPKRNVSSSWSRTVCMSSQRGEFIPTGQIRGRRAGILTFEKVK